MPGAQRILNFAAGPAKLPKQVMLKIKEELLDYGDTGMSVMELSHRGAEFDKILNDAIASLKELLKVPDNYRILFMQGGGTGQFASVALNLMGLNESHSADYIVTGHWSIKAAREAEKFLKVNRVLPKMMEYTDIPDPSEWTLNTNASYVYYCANETAGGVEFQFIPETNGVPIVCDMSSSILSRPVDISKFGVIYGGKNISPAGVNVVIIREDLIGHAQKDCPGILNYKCMADANSVYNTPPTFAIYVMGEVFKWVKQQGGAAEMDRRNIQKSKIIYDIVDSSDGFYSAPVQSHCRSRMNIPLNVCKGGKTDDTFDKTFLAEAAKAGLKQLNGHRSMGGIRVSLYNAITIEETQRLADFMREFQQKH